MRKSLLTMVAGILLLSFAGCDLGEEVSKELDATIDVPADWAVEEESEGAVLVGKRYSKTMENGYIKNIILAKEVNHFTFKNQWIDDVADALKEEFKTAKIRKPRAIKLGGLDGYEIDAIIELEDGILKSRFCVVRNKESFYYISLMVKKEYFKECLPEFKRIAKTFRLNSDKKHAK